MLKPATQKLLALFDVSEDEVEQQWLQARKERWEMHCSLENKLEIALPTLKEIGCVDAVHAPLEHYDYALVLGAIGPVMQLRLDYLYEEWKRGVRFDQIVLLSGRRDLDPKMEMIPEGAQFETDLFLHLFDRHPLKNLASHLVIDSPKQQLEDGTWRRPTTQSTIEEWLKTSPTPGKCLAASSQPFVGYQEAVIKSILPSTFDVDGVGSEITYPYSLAIYLDNIAKWLYYEDKR